MLRLKKIALFQLPELIWDCYNGDNELLEKYHIADNMDLKSAVHVTFGMIANAAKLKQLTNYKVLYNNEPIGYTTTFDNNVLYSYAIKRKFRKKNILVEWWSEIKKVLDKDFTTMLYSNNERAINFVQKQNMKILTNDTQNNVLTFINT